MTSHSMLYESTRGDPQKIAYKAAVLAGLAPDGGLYWASRFPQPDLSKLRGMSFIELADVIVGAFAPDILASERTSMLQQIYTTKAFRDERITPVRELQKNVWLQDLCCGPTYAFKDVALQGLPVFQESFLEETDSVMNIVGATSGDTGSAAEYGVMGKKRQRIFMLSPHERMSRVQQDQMYTIDDPNVFNLPVRTDFDGCQAMAKAMFNDKPFRQKYNLGAVNSFNWKRIVLQVVYYFSGYFQATEHNGQQVTFVVPSGNAGNITSGFVAQSMGLPISLVIATNENDVICEYLNTGTYRRRSDNELVVTTSPSMDIKIPSNFERLLYSFAARDGVLIKRLMAELDTEGSFHDESLWRSVRNAFRWGVATQGEVLATIKHVHDRFGEIIDPHTVVAYRVAMQQRRDGERMIILETAKAVKFSDTIESAIGKGHLTIPWELVRLAAMDRHVHVIDPDVNVLKAFIAKHALMQ